MRGRLAQLGAPGVQARTFHSAALRQLRYFWPQFYGGELPEIIGSKFALVAGAARRAGIRTDNAVVRDLASEIEWSKVSNVVPDDYTARASGRAVGDLDLADVAATYRAYEDLKRERRVLDFEDILLFTASMLDSDERIAAQVRSQYRWFVVDEFQDVNPLQSTLLDLWLGGRSDVCVVGDPYQTIYTFAGASPAALRTFAQRFDDTTRVELVRNYRSSPQIVAAANAVFTGSQRTGVTLQAQNPPGDPVDYTGHADEEQMAASVADEIVALNRRGVPYREVAVLFRINAQSEAFEEALGSRGVPFVLRGVEGFFQRPEVRQAVTLMRGAAAAAESGDLLADVRAVLSGMGHPDAPPQGAGAARDRWESLHALTTMATDLVDADPAATIGTFVADLQRRAESAHAPAADGVTLATFHSAKGLEWDAVFCTGLHEGMLPIVHAQTPEAVEEERRLFYVGITRARRHLYLTWATARTATARTKRNPTRFLDPLLPANHAARASRSSDRKVRVCPVCGQPLATAADRKRGRCADCPVTYDEALYERLRGWRTEVATDRKVPAYVVFNDHTLQLIAEVKPVDAPALLRISGVGRRKLEEFGESVLEIVGEAR
jgi:DNA helicase-2/ATP-dependent DNA helicase PcrA